MWWLIVVGILILMAGGIMLKSVLTIPDFAKAPCSQKECNGKLRWLKGRDAGSTGEAMFECKKCGHKEHRGGWASELIMERWDEK